MDICKKKYAIQIITVFLSEEGPPSELPSKVPLKPCSPQDERVLKPPATGK